MFKVLENYWKERKEKGLFLPISFEVSATIFLLGSWSPEMQKKLKISKISLFADKLHLKLNL